MHEGRADRTAGEDVDVYELSQKFYFEAAHTLQREHDAEPSKRVHGHTYVAEVGVVGQPSEKGGMVVDLAVLRAGIAKVRDALDHRMLDDVQGLGPATLENLCKYIWEGLVAQGLQIATVSVRRDASGDACSLRASAAR